MEKYRNRESEKYRIQEIWTSNGDLDSAVSCFFGALFRAVFGALFLAISGRPNVANLEPN